MKEMKHNSQSKKSTKRKNKKWTSLSKTACDSPKCRMFRRKGIKRATRGTKRSSKSSLGRKRGIAPKKRKQTKIGLWREWNVPDWAYHRYEGLKGIYWFWFSRTIRERDYERYSGI